MTDITTPELLARLVSLVTSPGASNKARADAIMDAYGLGCADGRVEGMKKMSDSLLATFDASFKRVKEGAT